MPPQPGIKFSHFFALTVGGLLALLGVLFYLVLDSSQDAVTTSAKQLRTAATDKAFRLVDDHLSRAEQAMHRFERQLRLGVVDRERIPSVETNLFSEMQNHPELAELTLTYGRMIDYSPRGDGQGHDEGDVLLEPAGRGQVSVQRMPGDRLVTRHVHQEDGRWVADVRDRLPGAALFEVPFSRAVGAAPQDPTTDFTFSSPANQGAVGRSLWSDLSFTQLDAALPKAQRRKVVTVQKAIFDEHELFVGVLRAALLGDDLDRLGEQRVNEDDPGDPHHLFITDELGRLITRTSPRDRYATVDKAGKPDPHGDLRVEPAELSRAMAAALQSPLLAEVSPEQPAVGRVAVGGEDHLVTFTALPAGRTQGWVLGIVAPESYYLRGLTAARDRLLIGMSVILACILVGGGLSLRAVRRGLAQIVSQTDRMRRFEFAPSRDRSPFRDVNEAVESLELAKTALRAMGKYVPVDLVRQLYQSNREPALGGELTEVSLMFTDIKSFTSLSEELPPNTLAEALGKYFQVMTRAVHATGGIVDKYIGDALMVMWNAPRACPDHSRRACEAALDCAGAVRALYQSADWRGLPAWHTRFGIHRDTVTVGHFGAPDRLSFTAIGDGVNLAARLEGLNKQYGTTILVSEVVYQEVHEHFVLRYLDRVAVKGKSRGIKVYELVGRRGEVTAGELISRYEAAIEAYFSRRFEEAAAILAMADDDEPSRVLAERCRHFLDHPPPPEWDGIWVAKEK
jgi:adenylate cyclase